MVSVWGRVRPDERMMPAAIGNLFVEVVQEFIVDRPELGVGPVREGADDESQPCLFVISLAVELNEPMNSTSVFALISVSTPVTSSRMRCLAEGSSRYCFWVERVRGVLGALAKAIKSLLLLFVFPAGLDHVNHVEDRIDRLR